LELSQYLFLHCSFAASIWYGLNRWLGVVSVLPPNVAQSYAIFVGSGLDKKRKKGRSIIWLAFIWAVLQVRNNLIFNNVEVAVVEVVDYIQRLSCHWFVNNTRKGPCLLYEWVWNRWIVCQDEIKDISRRLLPSLCLSAAIVLIFSAGLCFERDGGIGSLVCVFALRCCISVFCCLLLMLAA
jgi:hypothetical protein